MATIPYGYVYEIVNKINGKTYVGSRKLAKDKSWRQYMGSGRLIKSAIAKHGKENFVKRFLAYADSEASLCSKEWDLISSRRSNGYCQYNLFLGPGAGGDTFSRLKSKTLDEVKKAQFEQKQSKSFSISYEDAYRIWVVERGRILDIEDFVGCKSRTASYLLEGHGLPTTMRSRDKLREELNLD